MRQPAFAIWISGLPAAGKSTLARAVARELVAWGLDAAVLESAVLRPIPACEDDEQDLELFYASLAYAGWMLTQQGVPVIFDTSATRQSYRQIARQRIPRFIEVYLDVPLSVCLSRRFEPVYQMARVTGVPTLAGARPFYDVPIEPDLLLNGLLPAADAAQVVVARLATLGCLESRPVLGCIEIRAGQPADAGT